MSAPHRPRVAVVGGGPAGLIAAEVLAAGGASVTVYERMPSVGRKLLLAGRSGLNLTHAEPIDELLARYGAARARLEPAIRAFPPTALRGWAGGLGQSTFVGSSGRVFPEAMRAAPLLRAWLTRLGELGVHLATRHTWRGWDGSGSLLVERSDGTVVTDRPDAVILALGGASWPRVGSDGGWVPVLRAAGVEVADLRPANCGFVVDWSAAFRAAHAGAPLKNIRVTPHVDGATTLRGEAVITEQGIEGGVVYAVSSVLRDAIAADGSATLLVDLHPDLDVSAVARRLGHRRAGDSWSTHVRRSTGLHRVAIALVGEVAGRPDDPAVLARLIKALPITLRGTSPIERAISTAGGVALSGIDESWMLVRRPGVHVTGEMVDWEAPTGGYLLQATFSTAVAAARAVLASASAAVPATAPEPGRP